MAGAYERIVRLLAARPRTAAYLRQRLASAGHSEAEIDAALARAAELGYVNDRAFAENVAARLLATHAPAAVAQRLEAAGVAPALASEAIAALRPDEPALARALLEQRFGRGALDPRTAARAGRFLLGRGFDPELVERLLAHD